MQLALKNAQLNPEAIDYINAHGTSTPLGDEIEVGSVKKIFKDHAYKLSMSSTKSAIGHLLGAAGAVEAIFSIQAIRDNIAPPTLNLRNFYCLTAALSARHQLKKSRPGNTSNPYQTMKPPPGHHLQKPSVDKLIHHHKTGDRYISQCLQPEHYPS
jgi:hypothetical protein